MGSIFIINIIKGVFRKLGWNPNYIYKLIKLEYNNRYFLRRTSKFVQVEKDWLHNWSKSLRNLIFCQIYILYEIIIFLCGYFWPVVKLSKYPISFML